MKSRSGNINLAWNYYLQAYESGGNKAGDALTELKILSAQSNNRQQTNDNIEHTIQAVMGLLGVSGGSLMEQKEQNTANMAQEYQVLAQARTLEERRRVAERIAQLYNENRTLHNAATQDVELLIKQILR